MLQQSEKRVGNVVTRQDQIDFYMYNRNDKETSVGGSKKHKIIVIFK